MNTGIQITKRNYSLEEEFFNYGIEENKAKLSIDREGICRIHYKVPTANILQSLPWNPQKKYLPDMALTTFKYKSFDAILLSNLFPAVITQVMTQIKQWLKSAWYVLA